jgi:uncharacterized membrane protein (UPF0127 family)
MSQYIQYSKALIKTFLLLGLIVSCNEKGKFSDYSQGEITLPSGKKLKVYMAVSTDQQRRGLSNTKPEEFADDESMLFFDEGDSVRQFWMPETFFNLDIIFLNKDLYVVDVHRNIQHYTKREPREAVPLSKKVYCRHVLEIKASSPLAKEIKPGMMLKWTGKQSLEQTGSYTRQQQ